jgi:hypothetical protein
MSEDDDAIRLRAYQFWEQAGRPHGQHDEHWQQAVAELTTQAMPVAARKAQRPRRTQAGQEHGRLGSDHG